MKKLGQFRERPTTEHALRSQYDTPNWTPTIGPTRKMSDSANRIPNRFNTGVATPTNNFGF